MLRGSRLACTARARTRSRSATCAVYVDHGLRPAALDPRRRRSRGRAVGCRLPRVVPSRSTPGGNLEARARDARYAALARVAAEVGATVVAVAHTRDDQAETVLLNVLRGSAHDRPRRHAGGARLIRRPLLGFRRAEAREICALLRLAPVHDAMNDDSRFRRVWLRREVIPRLERDAQRDLVEVLARQAELLRDDDEYLDALAGDPGRTGDAARCRPPHRRADRARPAGGAVVAGRAASVARSGQRGARRRARERTRRPACGWRTHRARRRPLCTASARRSPPATARSSLPGRARVRRCRARCLDRARAARRVARRAHRCRIRCGPVGPDVSVVRPARRAIGSARSDGAAPSSSPTRWRKRASPASTCAARRSWRQTSGAGSSVTVSTTASRSRRARRRFLWLPRSPMRATT